MSQFIPFKNPHAKQEPKEDKLTRKEMGNLAVLTAWAEIKPKLRLSYPELPETYVETLNHITGDDMQNLATWMMIRKVQILHHQYELDASKIWDKDHPYTQTCFRLQLKQRMQRFSVDALEPFPSFKGECQSLPVPST